MPRFSALAIASMLVFVIAGPVAAAGPEHTTTSFTFTLEDAIAEYENFDIYDGDCGDFVLLVDFEVVRRVASWPDREIRHVRYEGHFYNASDTSKSIVRNGGFTLTLDVDPDGSPSRIVQTGLFEYVVLDGHRVPTIAGRSEVNFETDPPTATSTPRASGPTPQHVCDALR